jgi:hypothetical protein
MREEETATAAAAMPDISGGTHVHDLKLVFRGARLSWQPPHLLVLPGRASLNHPQWAAAVATATVV